MANPILNLGNNEWATKSESLLGYSKSGSNFKSVPFTHSRASIGTTIDRNGVLQTEAGNIPRIDFKDNIKGSLLLEPQRTNDTTYSKDFTQTSYWNNVIDVVVTKDEAVAPNGTYTANKIQANSGTNFKILRKGAFTIPSGITMSIFVKRGNHDYIMFKAQGDYNFNLNTLTWGGSYSNVGYELYPNDWIRLYATTTSSVLSYFGIYLTDSSFNQYWNATGNEFVYVWGAQYEIGSYPTSYILTEGSAVTRLGDECKNGGNADLFNDSEGVVFVDLQGLADVDATNRYITLSDGTATNSIMIQYRNSGDLRLYNGGTGSANLILSIAADLTERKKIAIQYGTTANNYKAYINGASQTISGSFLATSMSGLDRFRFDYVVDNLEFFGKVHQAMVFNEALSDGELQTLTTL